MALTRKLLAGLGIEDDKIQLIIDAHMETVAGLKEEIQQGKDAIEKAQTDSEALANAQKELDEIKKADYKSKYEAEKSEHEALLTSINNEKTKSAKENALKAYFESKNIKDGNLNIAMRGVSLDSIELDDDGKITDSTALDELVAGDYKPLIASAEQPQKKYVESGAPLGGHEHDGGSGVLSLKDALRESYDTK